MMKNALLLLLFFMNCSHAEYHGTLEEVQRHWPKILGPFPHGHSISESVALLEKQAAYENPEPIFFFVQHGQQPDKPIPVSEELHQTFQRLGVEFKDVELAVVSEVPAAEDFFEEDDDDVLTKILAENFSSLETSSKSDKTKVLGPASFHSKFVEAKEKKRPARESHWEVKPTERTQAAIFLEEFNFCDCLTRLGDVGAKACALIACIFENFLCPALGSLPAGPVAAIVKAICFLIKNLGLFKCLCPFVSCVLGALVELIKPVFCDGASWGDLDWSQFGDDLWACAKSLIDCLIANIWAYIKSVICPWCGASAASAVELPEAHHDFLTEKYEAIRDKVLRLRTSAPSLSYELEMFAVRYLEAHEKPLGMGADWRKRLLIKAHYDVLKMQAGLEADALECGGDGNTCEQGQADACTDEGSANEGDEGFAALQVDGTPVRHMGPAYASLRTWKQMVRSGLPLKRVDEYHVRHMVNPDVVLKESFDPAIHASADGFKVSSLELEVGTFWESVNKLVCCFIPCSGCCKDICGTKNHCGLETNRPCNDVNGSTCQCCQQNSACCALEGDAEDSDGTTTSQGGAENNCCDPCRCRCVSGASTGIQLPACVWKACYIIKDCIISYDRDKCLAALCKGACLSWICVITDAVNCSWGECWWFCFLDFILGIAKAIMNCYTCLCNSFKLLSEACWACAMLCKFLTPNAAKAACKCTVAGGGAAPGNLKYPCKPQNKTKYGFRPCKLPDFLCLSDGISFLESLLCMIKCCFCGQGDCERNEDNDLILDCVDENNNPIPCPVVNEDGEEVPCCQCKLSGCTCGANPPTVPPLPEPPKTCTCDGGECIFDAKVCLKDGTECEFDSLCRKCTRTTYPSASAGGVWPKHPRCDYWSMSCPEGSTMTMIDQCLHCGSLDRCVDNGCVDKDCSGDVTVPTPGPTPAPPAPYSGYGALETPWEPLEDMFQAMGYEQQKVYRAGPHNEGGPLALLGASPTGKEAFALLQVVSGASAGFGGYVDAQGGGNCVNAHSDCDTDNHCTSDPTDHCAGVCKCQADSSDWWDDCQCAQATCLLPWCINQCDPTFVNCFAKTSGNWEPTVDTDTEHGHGVTCVLNNGGGGGVVCTAVKQCSTNAAGDGNGANNWGCCGAQCDFPSEPPTVPSHTYPPATCEQMNGLPCDVSTDCPSSDENIMICDTSVQSDTKLGCCRSTLNPTEPPTPEDPECDVALEVPNSVYRMFQAHHAAAVELYTQVTQDDEYGDGCASSDASEFTCNVDGPPAEECYEVCEDLCETCPTDSTGSLDNECQTDCHMECYEYEYCSNPGLVDDETDPLPCTTEQQYSGECTEAALEITKHPSAPIVALLKRTEIGTIHESVHSGTINSLKSMPVGRRLAVLHRAGVPAADRSRIWATISLQMELADCATSDDACEEETLDVGADDDVCGGTSGGGDGAGDGDDGDSAGDGDDGDSAGDGDDGDSAGDGDDGDSAGDGDDGDSAGDGDDGDSAGDGECGDSAGDGDDGDSAGDGEASLELGCHGDGTGASGQTTDAGGYYYDSTVTLGSSVELGSTG